MNQRRLNRKDLTRPSGIHLWATHTSAYTTQKNTSNANGLISKPNANAFTRLQ